MPFRDIYVDIDDDDDYHNGYDASSSAEKSYHLEMLIDS